MTEFRAHDPGASRSRSAGRLVALSMVLAAAALPSPARADDCAAIYQAYEKLSTAPSYASVVTVKDKGTIRSIVIGDTFYVQKGSEWVKIPIKPGGRLAMMKSFVADAASLEDCRQVGTDQLDGRSMTAYSYAPPVPKGKEGQAGAGGAQKLWVGADGLPYRMSTAQLDMTISYDDVTAPIP